MTAGLREDSEEGDDYAGMRKWASESCGHCQPLTYAEPPVTKGPLAQRVIIYLRTVCRHTAGLPFRIAVVIVSVLGVYQVVKRINKSARCKTHKQILSIHRCGIFVVVLFCFFYVGSEAYNSCS